MRFKPNTSISEWTELQFNKLFEEGEFMYRYGPDLGIKPDQRFTSLVMGLRGYYSTYTPSDRSYGDGGHANAQSIYTTVIFIGHFLEQFIISHFDDKDPKVSRNKNRRTNHFSTVVDELEKRLSQDPINSTVKDIQFFKNHIWIVRVFAELRNSLIHDCNRLPYTGFLDILFVNYLAPLIAEILAVSDEYTQAIDRYTFCGVRALKAIVEFKLTDGDIEKIMSYNNRRLNHLKALGKAAVDSRVHIPRKPEDVHFCEELSRPLQNLMESRVKNFVKEPDNSNSFICPCCGTRSLLTMSWRIIENHVIIPVLANCQTCKYTIDSNQGEPQEFDIMTEPIFSQIPYESWLKMRGAKAHVDFINRQKGHS